MPEKILTDLAVKNAALPEGSREVLLGDGGNLFLRVRRRSKDWMFAWKEAGKKQKMMLGPYPDLGLAGARERALEARLLLREGKHPRVIREQRREEQAALDRAQRQAVSSVKELFELWHKSNVAPNYKDEGQEIRRRCAKDVLPVIGKMRPDAVKGADITAILDAVAARGANRIAGHLLDDLRQIFRFAQVRGIVSNNPTEDLTKKMWNGQSIERDRVLSEGEIKKLAEQIPKSKLILETECAIWLML